MSNDAELRLHLADELDLDADELAMLMAKKADSAAVKSVFKEVEALRQARISAAVPKVVERVSIDAPPAAPPKASKADTPVEAKVEAKPKARTQKASAKGQRSLFDF